MTNDIYKRPAVLPSEAVMLTAAESGDMGARPRIRPALGSVRKSDARMTAAQQSQASEAAVPTMWIGEQPAPVHNEAPAPAAPANTWLGRAALRSIVSGMPDVTPMPENTSTQPIGTAPQAQAAPNTRGALRSVVTDLLNGRGEQPVNFRPLNQAEHSLALPSSQTINLPGPIQTTASLPEA